jgi:hypothetical protein
MRLTALVLLALAALLPTGAPAQATLNKCIDGQGKVTYSNLPCRNAREARKVEIDPAPLPDPARAQPVLTQAPPAQPAASKAASLDEPVITRVRTSQITGKPGAQASSSQCDTLTDKLGRVFDKMDAARRKGYTQEKMNGWNEEIKALERKKQQSGCF